jgi:phosphoribosyl-ATP pyrophosphohydrolase
VNQEKLGEERFARLAYAVAAVRAGIRASPRTARLISGRISKMAQKVIEEASEVAIDAVRLQRTAVISESVDLSTIWLCFGTGSELRPLRFGPKWICAKRRSEWLKSFPRKR